MLDFIKNLFSPKPQVDIAQVLQSGAIVLDVRTPGEFKSGHVKKAINIPLDSIESNLVTLKSYKKPIVTCCRSGFRSKMAVTVLRKNGIEAFNGGTWESVASKIK